MAVRGDLSPGQQLAQAWHAGIDFSVRYPAVTARWHEESNNVVIVAVPGEAEVMVLESMALTLGLKHHLTSEPDLDNQITAIALEPGLFAKRLCASYPLALKELAMT